ncbi:hypothetical protein LINPERPRIM_LOCUS14044 [Linum perenne]
MVGVSPSFSSRSSIRLWSKSHDHIYYVFETNKDDLVAYFFDLYFPPHLHRLDIQLWKAGKLYVLSVINTPATQTIILIFGLSVEHQLIRIIHRKLRYLLLHLSTSPIARHREYTLKFEVQELRFVHHTMCTV